MSNAQVPPPREGTQPVTAPVDLPEAQALLEQAVGVPFIEGNEVTVLTNGNEIFPAMLEAIKAARHRIDFATYVYWQGDIADRFAAALAAILDRSFESDLAHSQPIGLDPWARRSVWLRLQESAARLITEQL